MKQFIAELLIRLAEKEEESQQLVTQVEALKIVVTAILSKMEETQRDGIISDIENAIHHVSDDISEQDALLLHAHIEEILNQPRH